MTLSKKQMAEIRTIDPLGVLMVDWGIKYTPPVKRMWPGKLMRPTHITQCPVCGYELWIDGRSWMCATCRTGGSDAISLVQHLTGCAFQRAVAHFTIGGPLLTRHPLSKAARQFAIAKTRRLEDIARHYDLALTETTETPYPWPWKGLGGKTFVTTCPICQGPLFIYINIDRQLWTCRQCNRGYASRVDGQDGDAIDLVRHLSGCSFNRAIWYLAAGGSQPKRKAEK
jgi:ribosomal protein L37AE/L43A